MTKEDCFEVQGTITDVLSNGIFRAHLDNSEKVIKCHISGKIRKNRIRIVTGDIVTIEVSTYDSSQGRITFRQRKQGNRFTTPYKKR